MTKEFKEKICPKCEHYQDVNYKNCEIRKCINIEGQKCNTLLRCFYYKKK